VEDTAKGEGAKEKKPEEKKPPTIRRAGLTEVGKRDAKKGTWAKMEKENTRNHDRWGGLKGQEVNGRLRERKNQKL